MLFQYSKEIQDDFPTKLATKKQKKKFWFSCTVDMIDKLSE